jgi:LPXTG-motif cell wall-anchored protein
VPTSCASRQPTSADRASLTPIRWRRLGLTAAAGSTAALGLALASIVLVAGPAMAAVGRVGLGTAGSFAVLAGSGITNTGATTITGDIGTFPTPSETGFGTVTLTGTNHAGDSVTQGAKTDLVTAYDDAASRTPATSVPVELGGTTLLAGVYTSPTFGLTGTLSLDAAGDPNAEFVFQAASTVIAESNSRVVLLNGADPCNVTWQVGSSATFKTGAHFVGDVLAQTSITAQTAATFQGRLLARNGAVTLDTNTISPGVCAATPSPTPSTSTSPSSTATPTGAATPRPSGTPTAATSAASTPGPTTGTSSSPAATPATTSPPSPGTPVSSTPSGGGPTPTRPHLPYTGFPSNSLVLAGLALMALGTTAAITTRRRRNR